jgi:hypothetical protein
MEAFTLYDLCEELRKRLLNNNTDIPVSPIKTKTGGDEKEKKEEETGESSEDVGSPDMSVEMEADAVEEPPKTKTQKSRKPRKPSGETRSGGGGGRKIVYAIALEYKNSILRAVECGKNVNRKLQKKVEERQGRRAVSIFFA